MNKIKALHFLMFLMLLMVCRVFSQFTKSGSVHKCVHATTKLAKMGDGTTAGSCMDCHPTYPTCATGCQALIDKMYLACDSVCLPYGYYFDPQWELSGCWSENLKQIKIDVERCGCNSAFRKSSLMLFSSLVIGFAVYLML